MAGHIVHNFNATTTNDFLAWAFGSYPFKTPSASSLYRTALGYTYGKVFATPSHNIPAYNSAGNQTFPDFSQASIFENPVGKYAVKKEAPQFGDTLTKVWGAHTIKIDGFTQTTDNYQSSFSYNEDGVMSFNGSQHPDLVNPGNGNIGSRFNWVAQFASGVVNGYGENNKGAHRRRSPDVDSSLCGRHLEGCRHLTLELGIRIEHVGHWYDRDQVGLAVFYPGRVLTDYEEGKYAPGYYWHAIDSKRTAERPAYTALHIPVRALACLTTCSDYGNTVVRGGWGCIVT